MGYPYVSLDRCQLPLLDSDLDPPTFLHVTGAGNVNRCYQRPLRCTLIRMGGRFWLNL